MLVEIWQSSDSNKNAQFFWDTVYIITEYVYGIHSLLIQTSDNFWPWKQARPVDQQTSLTR